MIFLQDRKGLTTSRLPRLLHPTISKWGCLLTPSCRPIIRLHSAQVWEEAPLIQDLEGIWTRSLVVVVVLVADLVVVLVAELVVVLVAD